MLLEETVLSCFVNVLAELAALQAVGCQMLALAVSDAARAVANPAELGKVKADFVKTVARLGANEKAADIAETAIKLAAVGASSVACTGRELDNTRLFLNGVHISAPKEKGS